MTTSGGVKGCKDGEMAYDALGVCEEGYRDGPAYQLPPLQVFLSGQARLTSMSTTPSPEAT